MRYRVSLFLLFLMMISFMFRVVATAQAQTYTYSTLYSFKKNGKDPASPESYLTVDAAGNLYGTSNSGGAFGFGTVFKVSKTGTLTVLHSFKGAPTDGANPLANVARDAAGNLY